MTVKPRLVLASALMLFLELALIRWLGSNIVHLSYFTNFVLLGSFLGIGLGFLLARTRALAAAVVAAGPRRARRLVVVSRRCRSTGASDDDHLLHQHSTPAAHRPWVTLPLIFCAVALALMGPAEAVGRCFKDLPPLDAYRLDLCGSIARHRGCSRPCRSCARPRWPGALIVAAAFVALLCDRRRRLAPVR